MIFFLNFICFHVLHNVWHKISTIFMMLKTFYCADLFSRPLPVCWSIYWRIMLFLCSFENIAKNHHMVYIATAPWICMVLDVRDMSGIFFLPTPWQPCCYMAFAVADTNNSNTPHVYTKLELRFSTLCQSLSNYMYCQRRPIYMQICRMLFTLNDSS